ncbi:MAG: hypothetical protein ABEL76_12995, partial [Bradymonadaceae bacterium]
PDTADPVAQISVPARSRIFRSGQRLVVAARARGDSEHATRLAVWDLSDPSNPVPEGTFLTDQVRPSGFVRWNTPRHRRAGGCPSCSVAREPGGGAGAPRRRGFRERPTRRVLDYRAAAVDGGLVFATAESNRELKGTRHVVQIEPERRLEIREACSWRERREGGCTYYGGAVHCRYLERPDGTRTPRRCSGTLTKCTIDSQGDRTCEKVGRYAVPTRRGSWSNEVHVRWKTFTFQMLDLSGKSPRLRVPVTMPTSERDVDFLARGSTVYVTHRTPYDKPGDSRPYRRYYVKTVDFSDPARPKIGGSVNIPGKLLAVRGDTLVTRDRLWGEHVAETSIDVLELRDGRAHLKAVRRFRNRRIDSVQIDRHRILVSHEPASAVPESETDGDRAARRLSVLQLDDGLRVSHAPRLPSWADLKRVVRGRALLSVPGGVLAADVGAGLGRTDAEFFPVRRWPADITVEAGQLYMAAGRYGLYRYDLPDVKAVVDRAAELRR